MIRYFIQSVQTAKRLRWEPVAALVLCGVVFVGALKPFIPFSSLLDLNERIKFSWEKPTQQAPIPHAELLTIAELATQAKLEADVLQLNLRNHGIEVGWDDVFGDIANQHQLSPDQLYLIATGQKNPLDGQEHGRRRGEGPGGGFGKQTLETACSEMGVDLQKSINALKAAGIEATPQMRIRAIADEHNVHPSQIRSILENQ